MSSENEILENDPLANENNDQMEQEPSSEKTTSPSIDVEADTRGVESESIIVESDGIDTEMEDNDIEVEDNDIESGVAEEEDHGNDGLLGGIWNFFEEQASDDTEKPQAMTEDHSTDSVDTEEAEETIAEADSDVRVLEAETEAETESEIETEASASDSESLSATTANHKDVGPGGAGAIIATKQNPYDANEIFASTDVNGIFRSNDAGATWKNISHDLKEGEVAAIEIFKDSVGKQTLLIATDGGLYRSQDSGDSWVQVNQGLQEATSLESSSVQLLTPMRSLAIDPKNPNIVWAGVGRGNLIGPHQYNYPFHVYRSEDAGQTWEPSVRFMAKNATVYDIVINPYDCATSCSELFAVTDQGLYGSRDGGLSWSLLGQKNVVQTKNQGDSYGVCRSSCDFQSACEDSGKNCLSLSNHPDRDYASLRGFSILRDAEGKTVYHTLIQDDGFYDDSAVCSGRDYKNDPELSFSVGGVYRSDDLGKSWQRLAVASDGKSLLPVALRCEIDDDLDLFGSNHSIHTDFAVNPQDLNHIIVQTTGRFKGLYEHAPNGDGSYSWKRFFGSSIDVYQVASLCESGCFEGDSGDGLWSQSEESSDEIRGIYGIMDIYWEDARPILYTSGGRALAKVTWSGDHYELEHLDQNPVATNAEGYPDSSVSLESFDHQNDYWHNTGLSDACVSGGMASLSKDGREVWFAGMMDYGVVHSWDQGFSWGGYFEEHASIPFSKDRNAWDVMADEEAKVVYVSLDESLKTKNGAVIRSKDYGKTWETIASPEITTGIDAEHTVTKFAIDHASSASDRRIWAGTKLGGLYSYHAKTSTWQQLSGSNCPASNSTIKDIWTDASQPGKALVSVQDDNDNGLISRAMGQYNYDTSEGVYLIDSSSTSISCQRLFTKGSDKIPVYDPGNIALAQSSDGKTKLIVSGEWDYWPVIYSTSFDFKKPGETNWEIVLDFYYKEEGGERVARNSLVIQEASNYWWDTVLNGRSAEDKLEYSDTDTIKTKDFAEITTYPHDPSILIASLASSNPNFQRYIPRHLYISRDAGQTWDIADEFADLPIKGASFIDYKESTGKWYFALSCSSLYEVENPF
ncbi:MAG: hypothetical protein H7A33_04955 [Deltaproteobacteria bacterium]|nr:hypothetical protein [Deltaproteobacteria bacterium]